MKKVFILLIVLLVLVGCATNNEGNAKISTDNEEIYFKYDGKNYTNNDAFQKIKAQNVNTYFEYLVAMKALEVEGISLDDKIAEIEENYNSLIETYGEDMVKMYFGEKESYIDQSILSAAYEKFCENYISNNIDTFINEYPSMYIEYVTSDNKTKMNRFYNQVKSNNDFDKSLTNTKFENNETVTRNVINIAASALPSKVVEAITNNEIGEISDLIEIDDGTGVMSYYVVRLISINPKDDYFDEYVSFLINNNAIESPTMIVKKQHNLEIFDDDFNYTYQNILKNYETEEESETEE